MYISILEINYQQVYSTISFQWVKRLNRTGALQKMLHKGLIHRCFQKARNKKDSYLCPVKPIPFHWQTPSGSQGSLQASSPHRREMGMKGLRQTHAGLQTDKVGNTGGGLRSSEQRWELLDCVNPSFFCCLQKYLRGLKYRVWMDFYAVFRSWQGLSWI